MENNEITAFMEQLIAPIKALYAELTTRGNKFCYPFVYSDKEGDYYAYILGLITAYVKRVKQLDDQTVMVLNHAFDGLPSEDKPKKEFDFLRDVDALSHLVQEVLSDCFRNYHDDAYQKLKQFFEADECFYLNMLPRLEIKSAPLYRIRTGSFDKTNDGEIFHIPFEKRHLVASQRYSVPGYPILYLAGSFFTAWCEMDKPDLIGLSYAGFQFKEAEYFIDLSYPYRLTELWEWYSLFVMYPLLMACMVRVKNPSAPFKPEYLMPQMMTKLVREHGSLFRGIVYMSNKIPESASLESFSSRNFAVLTHNNICLKGHDKDLAERMRMTDIQTITREQVRESVKFEDNKFEIDFKKLLSYGSSHMRDISVKMEVGTVGHIK